MAPSPRRIYLDHAATSWPKSPRVLAAIVEFYHEHGTALGRGSYAEAEWIQRRVSELRGKLANRIGAERASEVIWAFNGTDALSMAILGRLQPGDHVVTTEAEHNSVLRPLDHCQRTRHVTTTIVPCRSDGSVPSDQVIAAIRPDTRLVCVTAASNVTGAANELASIGAACHAHPHTSFLVDAAQAIGYLPIDVRAWNCDLLAAPGHKGLGGPLGSGFLYARQSVWEQLQPIRFGGTGTLSHETRQPQTVPDKFESGNLDGGNLLGLLAALDERLAGGSGRDDWRTTDLFQRFQRLVAGLRTVPAVRVLAAADPFHAVPVVSFTIEGLDSREVAALLDGRWHIECRSGFHCAPLICQRLQTMDQGGTVRVSLGLSTTDEEIDILLQAAQELAGAVGKL